MKTIHYDFDFSRFGGASGLIEGSFEIEDDASDARIESEVLDIALNYFSFNWNAE